MRINFSKASPPHSVNMKKKKKAVNRELFVLDSYFIVLDSYFIFLALACGDQGPESDSAPLLILESSAT